MRLQEAAAACRRVGLEELARRLQGAADRLAPGGSGGEAMDAFLDAALFALLARDQASAGAT